MQTPPSDRPLLELRVEAGPDRGLRCALAPNVAIGRGQECEFRLTDAAVSRRHLSLGVEHDVDGCSVARVLTITGSNPVWTVVDGQRVAIEPGQQLAEGTHITLGNTTIVVGGRVADIAASDRRSMSATIEVDARKTPVSPTTTPLAALAALGDSLARCGSLQAVFRRAAEWAQEVFRASRALLLTPDGEDVLAASGTTSLDEVAIPRTLFARVLNEQRAFLIQDVSADPELARRQSVQIRGIHGAMAAPTSHLVFYIEWGAAAPPLLRNAEGLSLLICAAQLVEATGRSARERQELRAATADRTTHRREANQLVGGSAAIQQLQVFLDKVAGSPATVLVLGESGTGKELVASLVHTLSPRAHKPFVCLNCAAIPESLLESELFGHERGAFTGAVSQHQGVFERAHTGTVFLDEIGDMSLAAQVRLLRVLESRRLTRVGGHQDIDVDVRLVVATHRDLEQMVTNGQFRDDLYYRIKVLQTRLPALRDRVSDIAQLVTHFVESLGPSMGRRVDAVSPDALSALERYPWPGNVRELRNVIERALVLGEGPTIDIDDLPPELTRTARTTSTLTSTAVSEVVPLATLEHDAIVNALRATEGNKARAAALLGIDRSTLYRKLKDLGVDA